MIDASIRSQGIGGSEIAAIVGMDPRRDKFAVYAEKLGLVERDEPSPRMKWGKRIERVIADAYADETRQAVSWWDRSISNPSRPWQVSSPDAFVTISQYAAMSTLTDEEVMRFRVGGVDAKNVAFDQAYAWGEPGTDVVPEHIALQSQWYMSASALPWWDIAALFGGYDLRIYRVHFDREIEAVLLSEAEAFWTSHVLAKNPPPIGSSATAAEYLRQRFPKNTMALRVATDHEAGLVARLKVAKSEYSRVKSGKTALENEVKEAIGEADGIECALGKVTWRRCKDTLGTDWEGIARQLDLERGLLAGVALPLLGEKAPECAPLPALISQYQFVAREGARKLLTPRAWGKDEEE